MPRSVLRVVAVILAACAIGGFVLGVRGAPDRARLPGEGADGGAPLQATDAQPLDDLVLTPSELAPAPPPPEEKAEAPPEDIAPAPPVLEVPKMIPAPKAPILPPEEDRVGDLIDGLIPPPEQPPY